MGRGAVQSATDSLGRDARGPGACREQGGLPRGHHSECPTSRSARLVIFGSSSAQSQQGKAAASNMEGLFTLKCASTEQGLKRAAAATQQRGLCPCLPLLTVLFRPICRLQRSRSVGTSAFGPIQFPNRKTHSHTHTHTHRQINNYGASRRRGHTQEPRQYSSGLFLH